MLNFLQFKTLYTQQCTIYLNKRLHLNDPNFPDQGPNAPQFLQTNTRCHCLSSHIDQPGTYHLALENLHIFWRALVEDNKDESRIKKLMKWKKKKLFFF